MSRVLTLAIEISNPSASEGVSEPDARPGVAIGEGARVLGTEPLASGRGHDDDLLPAIDRVTRRLGIGPSDLSRVAVSVGPGGFTSLRLAVAAAKMICEVTGATCRAVPTAKVAARAFGPRDKAFGVALASKESSVFVTTFEPDGTARDSGTIVGTAGIAALSIGTLLADGYLPAEIAEACAAGGVAIRPLVLTSAACFLASLSESDVNPLSLAPIYPREPEAVVKWRALHPEKYGRSPT